MIITKQILHKIVLGIGLLGVMFLVTRCTHKQPNLQNGIWRAELQRPDGHQVVFNFEVTDSAGQKVIYVFNAEERLRVDSIIFKGDSVFIQMPFFGSHFTAKINENGELTGTWTKNYGTRLAQMPFHAIPGDSARLPAYAEANYNISGSWETTFPRQENDFKAIGLFKQKGNQVTGTFLTPVGDYRYLQGVVSGDTLKLSGFDGCHALLFTAIIDSDNTLKNGKLYSINGDVRPWHAEKKAYDSLPAAYAVNNIQPGTVKLNFSLKDMQTSKEVSINDSAFKGKVVVIQLLGSWCPNCMDETAYLTKYYDENHQRGIEFIGIDFERTADYEQSKAALNSFFKHFDINYPVLFSGVASSDPQLTEKVFPNLPVKIQAFPTTIFIDKAGYVRKIHSGFNGPATGKYYTRFKKEFNAIVNGLLAE